MDKLFYTTAEVMELLSVGKNTIMALCRSKFMDFPATQLQRKYLINAKLLDRWVDKVSEAGISINEYNKLKVKFCKYRLDLLL